MADFGLELDLAISAVKDEEATAKPVKSKSKKKNTRERKKEKAGRGKSKDGDSSPAVQEREGGSVDTNAFGFYFNKNTPAALLRAASGGALGGQSSDEDDASEGGDGYLLHDEFDSDDDDTDSEASGEEGEGKTTRRRGIERDGSRKRADLRYVSITGNVPPQQLSIARHVGEEDLMLLSSGSNYGVAISKITMRRKAQCVVTIVPHRFTGLGQSGLEDEEDDDDGQDLQDLELLDGDASGMQAVGKREQDKLEAVRRWPPVCNVDSPALPTERRPGAKQSSRLSMRLSARPKSMAPPPPASMQAQAEAASVRTSYDDAMGGNAHAPYRPPPLKKQTSVGKATNKMAKGAMGVTRGMTKLARFRSPAMSPPSQRLGSVGSVERSSVSHGSSKMPERFVVAAHVPWVIPPPPEPALPPNDGSDAQQQHIRFELLRMFCEDLRSTALKIEAKQDAKSAVITELQEEIENVDDQIAKLIQPAGAANAAKSDNAITSQLKSVTTGKIFRVEKYED